MALNKTFVTINGNKHGMFIQTTNEHNPVLLFLHGGPGSPEVSFEQVFKTGLEKHFTICWWEQLGSGISFHKKVKKQGLSMQQMIADTVAVTNHLKTVYQQPKIYLMGHSWGSMVGIQTVHQHPEHYHAYIAIGQVVHQLRSEQLAWTYMLAQCQANNNHKLVKALQAHQIDDPAKVDMRYLTLRSKIMAQLGIGMFHSHNSSSWWCLKTIFKFKGYSFKDKINYLRGIAFSQKQLLANLIQTNYFETITSLKVPVYCLQGVFDYQTSYVLAKQFWTQLVAPVKGFYTFENSAHSPNFEEPARACEILVNDVLKQQAELAD